MSEYLIPPTFQETKIRRLQEAQDFAAKLLVYHSRKDLDAEINKRRRSRGGETYLEYDDHFEKNSSYHSVYFLTYCNEDESDPSISFHFHAETAAKDACTWDDTDLMTGERITAGRQDTRTDELVEDNDDGESAEKERKSYASLVSEKNCFPRIYTNLPAAFTALSLELDTPFFDQLARSSVPVILRALKERQGVIAETSPSAQSRVPEELSRQPSDQGLPDNATFDALKLWHQLESKYKIAPATELQFLGRFVHPNSVVSRSVPTIFVRSTKKGFEDLFVYMDIPRNDQDVNHGKIGYRLIRQPDTFGIKNPDVPATNIPDFIESVREANSEDPEFVDALSEIVTLADELMLTTFVSKQSELISSTEWMKKIKAEKAAKEAGETAS